MEEPKEFLLGFLAGMNRPRFRQGHSSLVEAARSRHVEHTQFICGYGAGSRIRTRMGKPLGRGQNNRFYLDGSWGRSARKDPNASASSEKISNSWSSAAVSITSWILRLGRRILSSPPARCTQV